jgi:hypothetical protein
MLYRARRGRVSNPILLNLYFVNFPLTAVRVSKNTEK